MMEPGENHDGDDFLCEINVTPLVDVMLVLLVIFIVTASAVTTAVHVNLPTTARVTPPDAKTPIVVMVDKSGDYHLNNRQLDLAKVKQQLVQIHAQSPERTVQLQADKDVNYGAVGKLMAAIQASGIHKIAVLSRP